MDKALLYCNFTMTVRFLIEYVYFEFTVLRRSKGLQWFVSFLVHLVELLAGLLKLFTNYH